MAHFTRSLNNGFLLVALTLLTSCVSSLHAPEPVAASHPVVGENCLWGRDEINLCEYQTPEQLVNGLLGRMTLKEKLGQMTQSVWHNNVSPEVVQEFGIGSIIHTEGPVPGPTARDWRENFNRFQRAALNTRLGIPLINAVDAVHGQNTFEGAVIFPHNIGMAASRNLNLIRQAAEITALESKTTGFHWVFAPCISMPRHEHWGRVYEGYGEHPAFTSEVAHTAVSGFQQFNGATYDGVAATAKHFLGDGASIGGVSGADTSITATELEERFLPPYQAAVDAEVAAVMVGFNSVNGVAMHQHGELIQDTLKNRLGFEGVVLTDWDGGLRYGPPETVINAGVDVAMQPGNHQEFIEKLESAIIEKRVSMDRINDAVRRILRLKIKTGVFKRPYFAHDGQPAVGTSERRSVARQAVRESLVLLKSENSALPLAENQTLYVVGEHADNAGLQSGGWSIHWQGQTESYRGATTILDGIKAMSDKVIHEPLQCDERSRGQTVVAVVGEQPYAEHLGDTDELWLPTAQKQVLETCRQLANRLIVILISGRPLEVNREIELSDAFIAAWLPGSEGAGIADFLFAKDGFKPVGKLPHPWPKDLADLPLEIGDQRALFPYGFGLQDF